MTAEELAQLIDRDTASRLPSMADTRRDWTEVIKKFELDARESAFREAHGKPPMKTQTPKSKKAATFQEWCATMEGADSLNSQTFGNKAPDYYLKNRLWRSWRAGYEAAEQNAAFKRPLQ